MKSVLFTPDAAEDIINTRNYIADVLKNPEAADRLVQKLMDNAADLSDNPEIGMKLSSRFGIETDYRYLILDKYIIVYRIDDSNVRIIRVFNGRQDYLKDLFPGM